MAMKELCANCGCTYGSHHGGNSPWPRDYCPGHEGRMDWENGPGTTFKPCTIWNELDDEGDPLQEDECYSLYPPPIKLPGCITMNDAVQIAGIPAWYQWSEEAAILTFFDAEGERMDLSRVDYARRQS